MTLARTPKTARPAPVPTVLRTALSGILCGAALAAWPGAAVWAQTAPAVQEAERGFAIAAGPLDQALNQFARAAGVNVSFDASQVERAQTQGLNGRWTTAGGLAALLAGTGFEGVRQPSGGYAVRRAARGGAVTLDAVTVTGQEYRSMSEGTGSYTCLLYTSWTASSRPPCPCSAWSAPTSRSPTR